MATIVRYPRLAAFFNLDQPVHHDAFGAGKVTAICGCTVTIAFCDQPRDLDIEEVVTRLQAEEGWQACTVHGANHRLEEGRWLWIVRSLCPHRGDWKAFLNKWGIPRSSAYDLIQRYLQERLWESQHTEEASGNRTKVDAGTQNHAQNLNKKRESVVEKERRKRPLKGQQPQTHRYWTVRIKLREAVAEDCQGKYNEAGDDAKKYWVRAAYRFVDREGELDPDSDATDQGGSSDE